MNKNILTTVISLILIAAATCFTPIHILSSNESADNPNACPYYITLQSLLTNYPSFSNDKANDRFIKNRLIKFESDLHNKNLNSNVTSIYINNYYRDLNALHVNSIREVAPNVAVTLARTMSTNIDNFYLNQKLFCKNPMYAWENFHSRRVLHFNFGGLFDKLDNRFTRIQSLLPSGAHLGAFPGFLVNNQTTGLGTQFMTGLPLLTALYVLPGHTYEHVGSYSDPVPWCAFWSAHATDPTLRKVMNIAGIDTFIISKTDLQSRIAKHEINTLAHLSLLKTGLRNEFIENSAVLYKNLDSYGLVYLANQIYYENPNAVRKEEQIIKKYFARPLKHHPTDFIHARDTFYKKLTSLPNKYDAIIESSMPITTPHTPEVAGNATILGMVGGRILTSTECKRLHCTLVLNVAKSPGWHAFVNGVSAPINRANFAFISTTVPKGKSSVWFIYDPLSQLLSYLVSNVALLMILIYTLFALQRRNEC